MISRSAEAKAALRRILRHARRALTPDDHERHSAQAARAIARLPAFRAGRPVAIYLPFDGEIATKALVSAAKRRGVRLYVPVVTDHRRRRIAFHALTGGMRTGRYGIPVPRRGAHVLGARWFALIVVPLVGIDPAGRRLGMGGGYYDRAFAFRGHRRHWRGPLLVGYAFDCQRVDSIFADPWDLAVDALATESGVRHHRRASAWRHPA
jgi:5-formyltetrahydrofolate cyclo-ligase